jgi:hypothetical protein
MACLAQAMAAKGQLAEYFGHVIGLRDADLSIIGSH